MIPILKASDTAALAARVMNRSQLQDDEISRRVKEIVARVRQEGDAALFDYIKNRVEYSVKAADKKRLVSGILQTAERLPCILRGRRHIFFFAQVFTAQTGGKFFSAA